jgi:hypothetical protein
MNTTCRLGDYLAAGEARDTHALRDCYDGCPLTVDHAHAECLYCGEVWALNLAAFQPLTADRIARHGLRHLEQQAQRALHQELQWQLRPQEATVKPV